jgi:hypothetical protein
MRQLVRRLGFGAGLGISLAIVWSQLFVASAAPMPKVGVAYQTSGGAGIANANYAVVADMVVPAGKYHVTARGTVNNQTGAPVDWVACNAYGGSSAIDSGTTSAQLQYAGFAIDGTADLPAGGTIRVECLSSVGAGTLPFVGISLVAESVAGISTLP